MSFCSAIGTCLGLCLCKNCATRTLKSDHIFKVPKVPKKVVPEEKVPVAPPEKVEVPAAKGTCAPDYH